MYLRVNNETMRKEIYKIGTLLKETKLSNAQLTKVIQTSMDDLIQAGDTEDQALDRLSKIMNISGVKVRKAYLGNLK